MIRGNLFAEEYLHGRPNSTYVKRYFVSFPYCGVKWFSEEPKGLNDHSLLVKSGDNCGWLYGSNISLHDVVIEDAFQVTTKKETTNRYPFRVVLRSGEHITDIRLAAVDIETRQEWVDELFLSLKTIQYVTASFENDFLPYSTIFDSVRKDAISSSDIALNSRALCTIAQYLNFSNSHKFTELKLVNVGLTDAQLVLINQIINASPLLETVHLSHNRITSTGVLTLCESLRQCKHLNSLDLSFNQIDDSCCDALTKVITPTRLSLKHLNLAHNQLTDQCMVLFIGRVATHSCKLTFVDFSHNLVGDPVSAFISLLLYNKPSHLVEFNVSHCGITDSSVKEITLAVPSCSSLKRLNIQGCYSEPQTLQAFMAAVSAHHTHFPGSSSVSASAATADLLVSTGLVVSIGGIEQDCDDCQTLRLKSLKVALPYVSEKTGVFKVTLRRHLIYKNSVGATSAVSFDKFSSGGKVKQFGNMLSLLEEPEEVGGDVLPVNHDHTLMILEASLPLYMTSIEELLESLAICLKIDASQLKLLNHFVLHAETRLYRITLEVIACAHSRVFARNSRNREGYLCCRDATLLHYDPILTADGILSAIELSVHTSNAVLRKLGLRMVVLKCPTVPGEESLEIVVQISGNVGGGRGLEDEYLVPISGKDVSQYEGNGAGEDTDDDEDWDKSVRDQLLPVMEEEEEADEDGEFDEAREARLLQVAAEAAASAEEAERLVRENILAVQTKKRHLKANNERLVLAVRKLYEDRIMSSAVAKFWEGAFGHVRHKEVTKKAMELAIEPVSGIFHSVHKRELMCNAMFQRDLDTIQSLLLEYKGRSNGSIEGGAMFIYGQRLYSEIVGLQKRFVDVEHVAQSYDKLSIVEDFLLTCGVLGYSGPEMFQAVELRQQLVASAISEGHPSVLADLPSIKFKALLSNLLISRDLLQLEAKMEELKYSTEDHLILIAETIASQTLLDQCVNGMLNLEAAIKTKDIETIDGALAEVAYHYFYSASVDTAITLLNAVSKNPSKLLMPIVTGLRDNDMLMINNGFEMLNKMGWQHPALDSVIVSRIYAQKSKLVQDDGVKSKLIKLCLAINNGFAVKAGEMMQLLRRAHAIHLEYDSDMKPYMTILNKHMRKYSGLVKQEKLIQKMIDDNDVPNLAKVLAGRGTGKLIMSAPSAYAQEEWLIHLEEVCSGNFLARVSDREGKFNEKELCFTGMLEKAARQEGGKIGGWRRRFFVLETIALTYFTKATNGEKKGSIRVLGGGVRKMDASETGGRQFCIELEEGRDITQINPDLLEEARRHVRLAKINEIQSSLQVGIKTKNLELLTKTFQFAADLEIMLNFDLMNTAKQCIQVLKEKNLKRDLHRAARLVPEGRLFELISLAESLKVDPNIASYARVIELASKSDIDQCLLRARGALEVNDAHLFRQVFKTLAKFDLSLLTSRQRYALGAVVMQHCGALVLTMMTDGSPLVLVYKLIRHALSCCRQLMVEPECMDAGRLLIALSSRLPGHASHVSTSEKVTSLAMYLEHLKIFNHSNPQLDARKFGRLRLNSSHAQKGIVSALFTGKSKDAAAGMELISFNNTGLAKSLLKYEAGVLDQPLCIEAFHVLNVIMGDRLINSLSRPKKMSILRQKATNIHEVTLNLIDAGAVRFPQMRDELYFQLIKQLSNNPTSASRAKGWLLFSLYLHAFRPSQEAFPYVKEFIADAFETLLKQRSLLLSPVAATVDSAAPVDATEVTYFLNLVSYCSKLVGALVESMQTVDARAIAAASSSVNISQITLDVVAQVFEQRPLAVEVTLMTGSVHQLSLPYGQFSSSFSLMCCIYDRLLPHNGLESGGTSADEASEGAHSSHGSSYLSERYYCAHVRSHQVLSLFRGFALYTVEESNYNEEGTDLDLAKIPVQPEVGQAIDFSEDLQWDLLLNTCNDPNEPSEQVTHSKFPINQSLVLRRRNPMASERFTDSYQLFHDEVSVRDISGLQALWTAWLTSEGIHSHLPSDHVRIDLCFAEDSRYVNSRLYPLSEESFHYLLALQLSLCWIDDKPDHWGEGDDGVIDGVTVAVRPCYKFLPRQRRGGAGESETDGGEEESSVGRSSEALSHQQQDHDSDSEEETRILHAKMQRAHRGEQSDDEEDGKGSVDGDSDESSSYQSSIEVDEEVVKEKRFILPIVCNYEEMHEVDREFLISQIERLGVALDSIQIDQLVLRMRSFHTLATNQGIMLTSEKYRYLLKRAYIQYLMLACPLYGNHFTELTLVSTSNDESQGQHVEDSILGALDESKVILGVSANGLTLLDPADWTILFKAPIWDIQECCTSTITKTTKTKVKGKKEPLINEKHIPVLTMVVNSLTLTLKGDNLQDIVTVMHDWTREVLGRGYFPNGSEYSDNTAASDAKLALQKFLMNFPLLPKPPISEEIVHSERYFEAPKSRREILARERAEEERVEQEMIRLANESQMERNQKQISQGREEMKKYQTESEADLNEDDDDDDGEKEKTEKKRSKRFNRSVFQKSVTSVDLREQLNYSRLCTAVSGVPDRSGSQLNVVIPSVPMMVNGVMKFDAAEKRRINFKPTIEESRGLEAVDLPQHVSISWNLAASIAVQPTKPSKKIREMKSSTTRLLELLMETRRLKVDAYYEALEEVEAEKLEASAAVEDNRMKSVGSGDDGDGEGTIKRQEKDAYLYGLNKYVVKKKAVNSNSSGVRKLRPVRESETVGGASE